MATGNPYIKVGGTWRQVSSVFVKVSGSWRPIVTGWVKVGGTWRQFFQGIISDLFNRSNTSSGLGTTDTGNAWAATRGNWYINNNKAVSGDTPSAYPIASVVSPTASPTINLDVDTAGGTGIAFWVTDSQNWWGLFPYTNIVTSYSQVCVTYSQTGPSYYCGGSYSQTGPNYYCSSVNGPYYGSSCSSVNGPYYGTTCNNILGPGYGSLCGSFYGPTYGSGCNSWSVRYDGFRGYWNATCSGGYYQVGPYYGCLSYYQTGPSYYCGGYAQTGPGYSCGAYTQTGPGYSCASVNGPYYGSSCSNPQGPNYSSSCASYSSSSSTSAGTNALRLIKSVANTVTTVLDQALSSLPASIKLKISGSTIIGQAFASAGQVTQINTDLNTTPTSPVTSTTHGIILAPGGYTQGTTVDNLTISV
jgi:hypothetical protein